MFQDFIRSKTSKDEEQYIETVIDRLQKRIDNGHETMTLEQDPQKKEKYHKVIEDLQTERNYYIQILHVRDIVIPNKMLNGEGWIEDVFSSIVQLLCCDGSTENKEYSKKRKESYKAMLDSPQGKLLLESYNKFDDYDFYDLPAFFHDITTVFNNLVKFNASVQKHFQHALKKTNK